MKWRKLAEDRIGFLSVVEREHVVSQILTRAVGCQRLRGVPVWTNFFQKSQEGWSSPFSGDHGWMIFWQTTLTYREEGGQRSVAYR